MDLGLTPPRISKWSAYQSRTSNRENMPTECVSRALKFASPSRDFQTACAMHPSTGRQTPLVLTDLAQV